MGNNHAGHARLESNIWKLNVYMILYSLMFFVPIIVLFFQENGLSVTQIMIIQSVSSLLFVLLEVPSGYFADIYGRKNALMITGIFSAIAMVLFAMGTDFYHFLFASILWATAGVFVSGADSALLYDTLIDLHKEAHYKKAWGNIVFTYAIGVSFASVIGGLLGNINYRYAFYAMIPFMLALIPLSLSFQEPQRHQDIFSRDHFRNVFRIIQSAVLHNRQMKWLLVYSAVIVGFIQIAFYLYQPYFQLSGIDIAYFGIIFAGLNVIVAISAKYAHLLEERIGQKYSLFLLFVLTGISYLLMSNIVHMFSFVFALLLQFVKGYSSVVISDSVHQMTDSGIRATVLSVKSLIEKTFFALMTPFIGWMVDVYSLEQALGLSGMLVLIFGGISVVQFWKYKSMATASSYAVS